MMHVQSPPREREALVDPTAQHYDPPTERNTTIDTNVSSTPSENCLMDAQTGNFVVCQITKYQCARTTAPTEFPVAFDYEMYYNQSTGNSFDLIVDYLEEQILKHVAREIGVYACSFRRVLFSEEQKSRFSGVSSEPIDVQDSRFATCASDYQPDEGNVCVPMQGGLTLYVDLTEEEIALAQGLTDTDKHNLKGSIYEYLDHNMRNDTFVNPGIIEKLVFLGQRPTGMILPETNVQGGDKSGLTAGAISGMAIALLFAIILIVVLIFRRNEKGKRNLEYNAGIKPAFEVPLEVDEVYPKGSLAKADSLALKPQDSFDTLNETVELSFSTTKEKEHVSPSTAHQGRYSGESYLTAFEHAHGYGSPDTSIEVMRTQPCMIDANSVESADYVRHRGMHMA